MQTLALWNKQSAKIMKLSRIALAAILAPVAAPMVMLVYFYVASGDISVFSDHGLRFGAVVALIFGYLGVLLTGPFAIHFLRSKDMSNRLTLFVVGLVAGVFVFWLFGLLLGLLLGLSLGSSGAAGFDLLSALSGAVLGGSVALAFGMIAGKDELRGGRS